MTEKITDTQHQKMKINKNKKEHTVDTYRTMKERDHPHCYNFIYLN